MEMSPQCLLILSHSLYLVYPNTGLPERKTFYKGTHISQLDYLTLETVDPKEMGICLGILYWGKKTTAARGEHCFQESSHRLLTKALMGETDAQDKDGPVTCGHTVTGTA